MSQQKSYELDEYFINRLYFSLLIEHKSTYKLPLIKQKKFKVSSHNIKVRIALASFAVAV